MKIAFVRALTLGLALAVPAAALAAPTTHGRRVAQKKTDTPSDKSAAGDKSAEKAATPDKTAEGTPSKTDKKSPKHSGHSKKDKTEKPAEGTTPSP
jgi:hypothetical protein